MKIKAMQRFIRQVLYCLPISSCVAFETSPWLDQWLEFHFTPSFLYRHYPYVQGGYNPKQYSSHDRFTTLAAHVAVFENMDCELLVECADTRKQSLGMQSMGAQIRYLLFDDIKGDFCSLTTHVNFRYVSSRSLYDVSCPYHGLWNVELGGSIGKEIEFKESAFLPYIFLGVGQANFGYPWVKMVLCLETAFSEKQSLKAFVDGYFGLGHIQKVNIEDFYGWGKIRHQDLEIGFCYSYRLSEIWGAFSLFYGYRFFAKNYPAKASTWIFRYDLPFSML